MVANGDLLVWQGKYYDDFEIATAFPAIARWLFPLPSIPLPECVSKAKKLLRLIE
jgi:hypothetical protein